MKNCDAIIIGGSAGSLDVLLKVFPSLSITITFPVIIVLHRKPGADSLLTEILSSKTKLIVKEVEEKEAIQPGVIYLAPSDYHLLVENNRTFSLDGSEKINYSRPSIDVTFQSAAEVYKENLVCLLLSGGNSDGAEGLRFVKKYGGHTLIQNPGSAVVSYMPAYAEGNLAIDRVMEVEEIGPYINSLSQKHNL